MKKLKISELESTTGGGCFRDWLGVTAGLLGVVGSAATGNVWGVWVSATVAFNNGYGLASGGCL